MELDESFTVQWRRHEMLRARGGKSCRAAMAKCVGGSFTSTVFDKDFDAPLPT